MYSHIEVEYKKFIKRLSERNDSTILKTGKYNEVAGMNAMFCFKTYTTDHLSKSQSQK